MTANVGIPVAGVRTYVLGTGPAAKVKVVVTVFVAYVGNVEETLGVT
jgi:hypothetical protein